MAFSGLIDFRICVPVILGDNIGTTITAQLAAIGTNTPARRTAMAHTLLNVIGVLYMFVPVYFGWYTSFIEWLVPGPLTRNNIMLHIALSHTMFNVVNSVVVFLPLIGILEKLSIRLAPTKPGEMRLGPVYLEKHLLKTPTLALEQARKEIDRMVDCARKTLRESLKVFFDGDTSLIEKARRKEDVVDNLQKEITQYLVELSEQGLDEEEAEAIPVLLHSINDVERVSDHAMNILELAERKIDQKLPFKERDLDELQGMVRDLRDMMQNTHIALRDNDAEAARHVLEGEKQLNLMQIELKDRQVRRVNKGKVNYLSGIIFNDFVNNIEKIGDHLTNIAQGVLRHLRWSAEPEYQESLKP
jgi:phosphate:Na+ symporter